MPLAMDPDAVKGSEVRSDSFVIPPGAMSSNTGEKILTVVTVLSVCKSTRAQCRCLHFVNFCVVLHRVHSPSRSDNRTTLAVQIPPQYRQFQWLRIHPCPHMRIGGGRTCGRTVHNCTRQSSKFKVHITARGPSRAWQDMHTTQTERCLQTYISDWRVLVKV